MLRPQSNDCRDFITLDGIWAFRTDPDDRGEALGYALGFEPEAWVAVPGSINEQLAERGLRDYHGAVWLMWRGRVPRHFAGRAVSLRFGSADLIADVWVDGKHLGRNDQPFLPFEYELALAAGASFTLVVHVDGRLDAEHPLPGIHADDYLAEKRPRDEIYPPVRYDFFPFIGLNRSVALCAQPHGGLRVLRVRTDYDAASRAGRVDLTAATAGDRALLLTASLLNDRGEVVAQEVLGEARSAALHVSRARPWQPGSPTLYTLRLELREQADGAPVDCYEQQLGLRRVEVTGSELRLNGAPVQLRGFGMHEDFPLLGKAGHAALRVKDFELLRWVGANSFRTSHYAYAEETLDEADRRGVLVVSEVASVNLDFRRVTEATLERHQQLVTRQIERDGGHACVIAWSLTNEPGYLAEPEYLARCGPYFEQLFAHARRLDSTRPLTAANVGRNGLEDPMFACCDFLSLNRYHGWYDMPGQLARATQHLAEELRKIAARWRKPLFLSEFGADAIPGMHASSDQLFTEEYQAEFVAAYWRVIEAQPGCIGGHVWNFADFRTAQHHRRVQFNHKGVFTRVRDPKMAAWRLRQLWGADEGTP
jgi:beta-glucuronidase